MSPCLHTATPSDTTLFNRPSSEFIKPIKVSSSRKRKGAFDSRSRRLRIRAPDTQLRSTNADMSFFSKGFSSILNERHLKKASKRGKCRIISFALFGWLTLSLLLHLARGTAAPSSSEFAKNQNSNFSTPQPFVVATLIHPDGFNS